MSYVWAGYGVTWVALAVYSVHLVRRGRELSRSRK